jgi:hypothetical protein
MSQRDSNADNQSQYGHHPTMQELPDNHPCMDTSRWTFTDHHPESRSPARELLALCEDAGLTHWPTSTIQYHHPCHYQSHHPNGATALPTTPTDNAPSTDLPPHHD